MTSPKRKFQACSDDENEEEFAEYQDEVMELGKGAKETKKTKQNEESMVQVFLRLKPLSEEKERMRMTMNRGSITVSDIENCESEKEYRFTKIFSDEADQKTVFDSTMVTILTDLFEKGKGALVFSYGNSGSGKTYTMMGNSTPEESGIIPRTAEFIVKVRDAVRALSEQPLRPVNFQEESNRSKKSPTRRNFKISVDNECEIDVGQEYHDMRIKDIELSLKAYEIYKQEVYDLNPVEKFDPKKRQKMKIITIKENSIISGLNEERDIPDTSHLDQLLTKLQLNRAKAETVDNRHSSRSHAVY